MQVHFGAGALANQELHTAHGDIRLVLDTDATGSVGAPCNDPLVKNCGMGSSGVRLVTMLCSQDNIPGIHLA